MYENLEDTNIKLDSNWPGWFAQRVGETNAGIFFLFSSLGMTPRLNGSTSQINSLVLSMDHLYKIGDKELIGDMISVLPVAYRPNFALRH